MAQALLRVPPAARAGEVVEVRVLLQHPMETGFRPGPDGALLPRDIVRRVEATVDGERVFAADLFPAIAANPYLAFALRVDAPGVLVVAFHGDHGFQHAVTAALRIGA